MLVVDSDRGRQVVVHLDQQAHRAGVRPGMTLAHARALLPSDTRVETHDPLRDQQTLTALGRWAMRFTPVVAPDPPDGLLLDTTGCAHLFGGEKAMVRQIIEAVRQLGFTSRVALTPSIGASWALARFAGRSPVIVEEAELPEALNPLPIAALRIDEPTITALQRVGIHRIDQLLALARSSLRARFGELLLLRIDQAFGEAFETFQPLRPQAPLEVTQDFDGPVKQLEAVQEATRDLIDALADRLEQRESGVARLRLEVKRVEATDLTETLSLSRPSRNAKHLWKLFAPRIEKLNLGYGIDRLTLRAERTASLPHDQTEAWPTDTSSGDGQLDESVAGLVDQLTERLGAQCVQKAIPADTYVPERAFRFQPVHKVASRSVPSAVNADRPSVVLDKPQKVEVVLLSPDGPVVSVNRNGETSRIVTSIGPERITPRWWLTLPGRSPRPRDYFKVQDEAGQWWWLYRKAGTSKWFVHGIWC